MTWRIETQPAAVASQSAAAAPLPRNAMNALRVFDIETGPGPLEEIAPLIPPFDPPANIRDPVKIEERRREHAQRAIGDAALSAITGRVIAIGVKDHDGIGQVLDGDGREKQLLVDFWRHIEAERDDRRNPVLVGFNSHQFDLPFLLRRSWIHGVPVPGWVRSGRWWDRRFVDLRELWLAGTRDTGGSLDTIAKACGLGAKTGSGAEFAALWMSDRARAVEYLTNDLAITEALAVRLGVESLPA